ncbi:hypothetical protein ACLOJK_015118 [Asimina triloba]
MEKRQTTSLTWVARFGVLDPSIAFSSKVLFASSFSFFLVFLILFHSSYLSNPIQSSNMTDRVYPSSKPPPPAPASSLTSNPPNPAPKPNLYRPPIYRPTPQPKRRRGNRCCLCCIWSTIFILSVVLLAAIAACILYVLYRPHAPAFSVTSLRFSSFNLTSSTLNSHLNLSISARNPNKNLVFFYDPITVSIFSGGVDIGDGSFPAFVHDKKNLTVMRTSVATAGPRDLDPDAVTSVGAGAKKKGGLPVEIRMDAKLKVKMGGLKTKKVRVRVNCGGISAAIPKGKSPASATSAADSETTKCKVKIRVKIWKWEF